MKLTAGHGFLTGAAIAGFAVAAWSGDWICSTIGAALLCGLVTSTWVVIAVRLAIRRRVILVSTFLLAGIVAATQCLVLRSMLRNEATELIFAGAAPPAAIRDFHVSKHYAGGPGDVVILATFRADPTALAKRLAALPPSEEPTVPEDFNPTYWPETWKRHFSMAMTFDKSRWSDPPKVSDPLLHTSHYRSSRGLPISRTILIDLRAGQIWAIVTGG